MRKRDRQRSRISLLLIFAPVLSCFAVFCARLFTLFSPLVTSVHQVYSRDGSGLFREPLVRDVRELVEYYSTNAQGRVSSSRMKGYWEIQKKEGGGTGGRGRRLPVDHVFTVKTVEQMVEWAAERAGEVRRVPDS